MVALFNYAAPPYRLPLYALMAERLGVEVFLHDPGHPAARLGADERSADAGFPVHVLPNQFAAFSAARRADAVICAVSGRVALPAAFAGARSAGRPFVLWATMWEHPATAVHRLSELPMRSIYRRADAVATYGPHVSEYVSSIRGPDGVFEVPQSVDNDHFGRTVTENEISSLRRHLELGDGPIVLFVGRIVREKGIPELLAAWRAADRPPEARLLLVGEGPLARGGGGEEGVRVAGPVANRDLPPFYAASSFLVLPSVRTASFTEPWGLVTNEAMCQARPVIATTAVGATVGGLVRDGSTGIVVPERAISALAAAIARLLADPGLAGRLGDAARGAVSTHTFDRMTDAFGRALSYAGKSRESGL